MRFQLDQTFNGPLATVEAAFLDPAFLERVSRLPKVGGAELLDQRPDGDTVHQRIRYRFTGDLSAAAKAIIHPDRLTWVEESTTDRRTHVTTWRIVPDHYADRLRCSGTFTLSALDGGRTRRRTEADLKVSLPLVGGKVEQAIVSGLKEHAAGEEQVMADWLADEREGG